MTIHDLQSFARITECVLGGLIYAATVFGLLALMLRGKPARQEREREAPEGDREEQHGGEGL